MNTMFKKRSGTSGIRGHLYETKLLSLILFRALHDNNIEEFNLASNLEGTGAFDDICFKARIKGNSRPLRVFIQAKHRENNTISTLSNKNELVKYFDSYLKIKQKIGLVSQDPIFGEQFDETECIFIMYTTEKGCKDNVPIDNYFASHLNSLIATGDNGSQPCHADECIQSLSKIITREEISILAKHFARYLNNKAIVNMMSDEYIIRYHTILARNVVDVSEIEEERYRTIRFRSDFFDTKDEYLMLLRDKLYLEVLKNQKIDSKRSMTLILEFLLNPNEYTLSFIIEWAVVYNNGKLQFVKEMPKSLNENLEQIHFNQFIISRAIEIGAKFILQFDKFQVPITFGNLDIAIRGNQNKIQKRLDYIISSIKELIEKSQPQYIIVIDKSVGDGLLQLNGGLASAVGNLLVYDDSTKLLKFADDSTTLENHAKWILLRLKNEISNLHDYRFEVKDCQFPKPSFETGNDDLIRAFLNAFVYFTDQANENNVEDILKKEIENHQSACTHNYQIKSDAIFLRYHDKIQKWWMNGDKEVSYLTKLCHIYQDAVHDVVNNSIITITNMMFMNKIDSFKCKFNEGTSECFKSLNNTSRTIVVSSNTTLTALKVMQSLKFMKFIVLDLNFVLGMITNEFSALISELESSNNDHIIIIVCENLQNHRATYKKLEEMAHAVDKRKIVIITNAVVLKTIKKYFSRLDTEIQDQKHNITDLSEESRRDIIKNSRITFQDQEMSLDMFIDDVSLAFIEGAVLKDIIYNKSVVIGHTLSNSNYEEIKDLHIDRKVYHSKTLPQSIPRKGKVLRTLLDIKEQVILVTAKPGMGKSTLLTHLSLKTKELDKKLWIVRINLLDYSQQFYKWQKDKTDINILKTLKFMSQIILKKRMKEGKTDAFHLKEINGEVFLQDFTGDEWVAFELKLFLHFYNRGNLIFLFDGFDEICPYYAQEVISFLNCVKAYPRHHKMWITSRSYNNIKAILQENFGASYELEHLNYSEQSIYLDKFWQAKLVLSELNSEQLNNLCRFEDFVSRVDLTITVDRFANLNKSLNLPLIRVYSHLVEYLQIEESRSIRNSDAVKFSYERNDLVECLITMLAHRESMDIMIDFAGTPLHLYLLADYLLNEIKDVKKNDKKWDIDVTTFTIFEKFLETKLKKIRFQDKNKMDVYNPDIMMTYEKERANFIAMHKKLAAYAVFQSNGLELFNKKQLKEIKLFVTQIKKGKEKSGLITNVVNDIPQFIHLTFAEYFAVEYICDLLKKEAKPDRYKAIWNVIAASLYFGIPSQNLAHIMEQKLKIDPVLAKTIEKNKCQMPEKIQIFPPFNGSVKAIRDKYEQSILRNISFDI